MEMTKKARAGQPKTDNPEFFIDRDRHFPRSQQHPEPHSPRHDSAMQAEHSTAFQISARGQQITRTIYRCRIPGCYFVSVGDAPIPDFD
jgi:hypothetical protein